jgi:hypothetical protein
MRSALRRSHGWSSQKTLCLLRSDPSKAKLGARLRRFPAALSADIIRLRGEGTQLARAKPANAGGAPDYVSMHKGGVR